MGTEELESEKLSGIRWEEDAASAAGFEDGTWPRANEAAGLWELEKERQWILRYGFQKEHSPTHTLILVQ